MNTSAHKIPLRRIVGQARNYWHMHNKCDDPGMRAHYYGLTMAFLISAHILRGDHITSPSLRGRKP